MKPDQDPLQIFMAATTPDVASMERLRNKILERAAAPGARRFLLSQLDRDQDDTVQRVRNNVLNRVEAMRLSRLAWFRYGFIGLTAAAAAIVLVMAGRWVMPTAQPDLSPQPLVSDAVFTDHEIHAGVWARYQGTGTQHGDQPLITWQIGVLVLSVDPEARVDVTIQTQEAEVRVVGTVLTVDRDALGTSVRVAHGRVEVTCSGEATVVVPGGQTEVCLPRTAAGMLGRAEALERDGATSDRVHAAINRGLKMAQGPIEGELRAFRIQHLIKLGQTKEALKRIDEYHESGTTLRRRQVLAAGVDLAMNRGDCRTATRYLEPLLIEERTVHSLTALAQCTDGSERRALLDEAFTLATNLSDRQAIRKLMKGR